MKLSIQPLSQRDNRWKRKKLGFSRLTLGGYGCVVTCLAMISQYFGKDTNPGKLNDALKKVNGFAGGLIIWDRLSKVYSDIKLEKVIECPLTPAPLNEVDYWLLEKKCPIICWVDFNPDQKIQQHFVLIVGKDDQGHYLINDPWTGETYYLYAKYPPSAERSILGIRIYSGKTYEEKIYTEAEMTETRRQRDKNWHKYLDIQKEVGDVEKDNRELKSKVANLKDQIASLNKAMEKMATEDHDSAISELEMSDKLKGCKKSLKKAEDTIITLEKDIEVLEGEKKSLREALANKQSLENDGEEVKNMTQRKDNKKIFFEALKEPLRLLVLAIIPFGVSYFKGLPYEWATLATVVLKFIDRFLHQYGKVAKDERLVTGLTRF